MEEMVQALESSFKSKRLAFRPIENSDKEFIFVHQYSDPVIAGLGQSLELTPIDRATCDERVDLIKKTSALAVMILAPVDASDGDAQKEPTPRTAGFEPVGYISLRKQHDCVQALEIGLGIAAKFQNKGYGREAINFALDWAFGYAHMHRVAINTIAFNERAIGLYKSIGFVEEGRLRHTSYFNNKWWDYVQMSMLQHEYRALRGLDGK